MKESDQKMWLLIDGIVKKMKNARYWTTSVDSYNREFNMVLRLLEEILRKIEDEA